MNASVLRTLVAGLIGGLSFHATIFATFGLIGIGPNRDGIILDPDLQSPKLIAVWTTIEPLPLVLTNPGAILLGLVLFAIAHAFVYRSVARAWPSGMWPRTWRLTGLLLLSFAFFEFFTPFNLFGEPIGLIGVELSFWAAVALAEAATIVVAFEWKPSAAGSAH